MLEQEITAEDVFKEIVWFYHLKDGKGEEYKVVPSLGFLAGYFKTSKETIRKRLIELETNKLITRIYREQKAVGYTLN